MLHKDNPRFPHTCVIKRPVENDNPMEDDDNFVAIYKGRCRSYAYHTTSDSGAVLVSTRKLSRPVDQQEWTSGNIPQEGDIIEVDKGSYKEYGVVIDRMPGNLGTHLLWKYGRN